MDFQAKLAARGVQCSATEVAVEVSLGESSIQNRGHNLGALVLTEIQSKHGVLQSFEDHRLESSGGFLVPENQGSKMVSPSCGGIYP